MGLTVDFTMGFVCFDAASKVGVRRSSVRNKRRDIRARLSDGARKPCSAQSAFRERSFQTSQSSCRRFWPLPKSERCADSPAANRMQTLPYCSEILAPVSSSICVPQGCDTCCQSIVYTKKRSNQNPHVLRYEKLCSVRNDFFGGNIEIESCYWQISTGVSNNPNQQRQSFVQGVEL